MIMLWLKAFHIFFVVSWFAGLFYLPRIYVNLAMVPADSEAERERLLIMSRKLYKFVTPIGALAVITGLWLWFGFGDMIAISTWVHVKTALVAGLVVYHLYCGRLLRQFQAGTQTYSHVWFRFFNEVPVFFLLVIVLLVILKPF